MIRVFALLLVPWLFSPAHAFTSKDDCLKRVEEFNSHTKTEAPEQAVAPHHANTIFELKKKCSLQAIDETLQTDVKKGCPTPLGQHICDKLQPVAARGLTAEEKSCIERRVSAFPKKLYDSAGYSIDTVIMAAIIGDKCVRQ
jgi:hypothetical protein